MFRMIAGGISADDGVPDVEGDIILYIYSSAAPFRCVVCNGDIVKVECCWLVDRNTGANGGVEGVVRPVSADGYITQACRCSAVDVDINDFSLDVSGITGASVTDVTGSGDARAVIVDTGSGNGTIRLDMPDTADISDLSGNQINGLPFAGEEYTILKTPTFADVPFNGFGWAQIESIYAAGITGGCTTSPLNYCPNQSVTRAQMAVFLLRGIHGSSYTPPPPTGTVFNDVPLGSFAAAWIEQMVDEGITAGCGGGNFCPNQSVTRAQMAVFLLRAKHGSSYTPPSASGTVFNDVPPGSFAAAWIEQLVAEGITSGCGAGNYCPNQSVTRAQMAVFLQRTFNLPMP